MTAPQALFFYGTLRHLPLLETVVGRTLSHVRLSPARLPGHEALWVRGECFPMIRAGGGGAEGLLAEGLTVEDIARLDYYEGGYLYERRGVTVEVGGGAAEALVYFPNDGVLDPGDPFDIADWAARWGDITLRAATEFMAGWGRKGAGEMATLFPRMRARAWSQLLAGADTAPSDVRSAQGREAVTLIRRTPKHTGFFVLDAADIRHPAFRGGTLDVRREVFVGSDAALVLPYDPARDLVALVEQFRAGPFLRGDPRPWALEPVAGLVDPGESPEDCARREALEEAGLTLGYMEPVMRGYPSPGATTEFYHLFVGLCPLDPARDGRLSGGVEDEGEDIRTHVLPLDDALALIPAGEANVLPLALLLLWTAANRDRLTRLA